MPRRVEPDPSTWWETYGHRLEGPPVAPRGAPGPDGPPEFDPAVPGPPPGPPPGPYGPEHPPVPGQAPPPGAGPAPAGPGPGPQGGAPVPGMPDQGTGQWPQQGPPSGQWRAAPQQPSGFGPLELSEDSVLRPRAARPAHGWRRVLFELTGGRVNPGPGAAEEAREALLARIRGPLAGAHRVAVTSIKGGVGKTTVATCLGLTLAENRGDRAVVLDANPDAGTLADRLTGDSRVTVRELLDDLDQVRTWTDVSRYTSLAGRLQVLASEQDPAAGEAFRRDEYERVAALLGRFFNIIVTDSGTGLVHSAMEGTLAAADSLVVVGAPTVDGASRASKTLDWLVAHDHGALARDAIVVLCCDRSSSEVDGGRIREHFAGRVRAVVEIPHDPHLATGGRVDLTRLRPATADAFLELGALIGDAFDVRAPGWSPARP